MLAHYLVANVGYKVAPHRFQIAGWWPLIFHPKACCLQSGPYKVALINHNVCIWADLACKNAAHTPFFIRLKVEVWSVLFFDHAGG